MYAGILILKINPTSKVMFKAKSPPTQAPRFIHICFPESVIATYIPTPIKASAQSKYIQKVTLVTSRLNLFISGSSLCKDVIFSRFKSQKFS